MSFKVSSKAKGIINGGFISEFHDCIQAFSQAFRKDGYSKINELLYFKSSAAVYFSKYRVAATELVQRTFFSRPGTPS